MMVKITALTSDLSVPNTFFRQEVETDHLVLILPGLNYTCDMPLLYYAAQLMLGFGADVLQLKSDYTNSSHGKPTSLNDKLVQLKKDVTNITKLSLEQRNYQRLTVIGKSLGTLGIPYLLDADLPVRPQTCIFLTPILKEMLPAHDLIQTCPHTLHVIGTIDPYYDPELIAKFRKSQPDNFLIIEGVNHSLEVPGELLLSLSILETVIRKLENFVSETLS